ncbi:MAG: nodulation protein NfeD [Mariniblastus sp.]
MKLAQHLPTTRFSTLASILAILIVILQANCGLLLAQETEDEIAAVRAKLEKAAVPDMTRPRPKSFSKPALIQFKGEIDEQLTFYFKNRFAAAKKAGVDLLIIEIDSPGGLKIQSMEMASALRDCKWAYTVAIVSKEAISGGALVSIGCDEIQIAPTANFGDAGEIGFDPEQWAWRMIESKIESYLDLQARNLAESKGRPKDLAIAMVDQDHLVYVRTDADGKQLFQGVGAGDLERPGPPWQLIDETREDRFLAVTGQRAVELEIAQGHLSSRADLAEAFNFDLNSLKVYQPTTTDTVVYYLNKPLISGLLILIGLIALYFELSAPGIGVGGLTAGLCAVLFFWSHFLGGTAGMLEVVLFISGIVFICMELFVIPGFGVAGLGGLALLFSSVILASQDYVLPQTADQWNQSLTTMLVMLGTGVCFLASAAFISRRLGSLPIFNKMILAPPPIESEEEPKLSPEGKPLPQDHPKISVGDWGRADSLLRPAGRARFAGNSFDVISDGAYVDAGTQVRVIRITGNIITVSAIEKEDDLGNTEYKKQDSSD